MRIACLFLLAAGCSSGPGANEDGFVPLFNGKDFTGWVRVNCAPETFRVEDGIIISTGKPTGVMRTGRMYENYVIEIDWMHMKKGGNAGLFVHSGAVPVKGTPFTKGHEIQVLDGDSPDGSWTGHGDVFSIHGATFEPDRKHPKGWMRCLPSEKRANPVGQWNHYRVTVNDGTIKLEVNGKAVSGGTKCNPRKGYICLESEGSECRFKNIRIKELPSTNPPQSEISEADEGFKSLYTGLDLRGWKTLPEGEGHWNPKDWVLEFDGKGEPKLSTDASFRNFVVTFDWRVTGKLISTGPSLCIRMQDGGIRGRLLTLNPPPKAKDWVRTEVRVEGNRITIKRGEETELDDSPEGMPDHGRFCLLPQDATQFTNLFVRELK